ncbi:MAG: tetratricopeptide repeat protein [Hyphomicrobiaceae bacterium]
MQCAFRTAVMVVVLALPPMTASADDLKSCEEKSPEATIAACTRSLDEIGQQNKQLAFTLYLRGDAYFDVQNCQLAIADYSSAIEVWPNYAGAFARRGSCRLRLSEFDLALLDMTVALQLDPTLRYVRAGLAAVWRAKGEALRALAETAAEIDMAAQATGTSAYDAYYRGFGRHMRRQFDVAIREFSEAIALDPTDSDSYSLRGDAHFEVGSFAAAIADYTASIGLKPEKAEDYFARGEAHLRLGERDNAVHDLEAGLSRISKPQFAWDFGLRAWALLLLGRLDQGLADAEAALKRLPNDPNLLHSRGRLLEALGRRDEAMADYRLALRFDPSHFETLEEMRRLGEIKPK